MFQRINEMGSTTGTERGQRHTSTAAHTANASGADSEATAALVPMHKGHTVSPVGASTSMSPIPSSTSSSLSVSPATSLFFASSSVICRKAGRCWLQVFSKSSKDSLLGSNLVLTLASCCMYTGPNNAYAASTQHAALCDTHTKAACSALCDCANLCLQQQGLPLGARPDSQSTPARSACPETCTGHQIQKQEGSQGIRPTHVSSSSGSGRWYQSSY